MTRFNLYLVMGLLAGAAVARLIAEDSGYVMLRWRGWQIETSLWLALGLGLAMLISLALLREFLRSTLRIPKSLRQWLGLRSARGAQRRADKGLAAFFEGRWDVAESALGKVHASEAKSVLHPVYAAIAAGRGGHHDQAKQLLDAMEREGRTPEHLVLLARAECFMAEERYGEARKILTGLSGAEGALPRAKKRLAEVAYAKKAWSELIGLIADVRGYYPVASGLIDRWEREAYSAVLSEPERPAKELLALWRQAPEALKQKDSEVWESLVRNLVRRSEWELLQKVLIERFKDHDDKTSLDAVLALPDRQVVKLQKALRPWLDKDRDGRCHAALAYIAEQDGRSQEAGECWQKAYALGKLPVCAAQWSRWLRLQGDEARATAIEREAVNALVVTESSRPGSEAGEHESAAG